MKQIQAVSIWDNGTNQSAEILNAYAVNVTLNVSATFYYSLLSESKQTLASGNLTMSWEAYAEWSNDDDYAWEWIAGQLNLVIVGDWVDPIVEVVKENLTSEVNSIGSDLNQMLIKGA
jgi:hypothetical protein